MSNNRKPEYKGVGIYFNDVFYIGVDCATCGTFTIAQPEKGISIRLPNDPHTRRAICPSCVKRCNDLRVEQGIPPMQYSTDAYIIDDSALATCGEFSHPTKKQEN